MTPQEATSLAEKFLRDGYGNDSVANVRLEEVDLTEEGRWLITLSFGRKDLVQPLSGMSFGNLAQLSVAPRDLKVFTVDEARHAVVSMKNRGNGR